MNPADVALLLQLIRAGTEIAAGIKNIKENKPEVFAYVAEHHADVLAQAEAIQAAG